MQLISLLGLATVADFEIRIAGWLDGHGDSALPTLPEIHRIDGMNYETVTRAILKAARFS